MRAVDRRAAGLARREKVRDVTPQYPPVLRGSGTEGTVKLEGTIGLDGYLGDIRIVGDAQPDLAHAAIAAVREWRFTETLLNCEPTEVGDDHRGEFPACTAAAATASSAGRGALLARRQHCRILD